MMKRQNTFSYIKLGLMGLAIMGPLTSCEDFWEDNLSNEKTEEIMVRDANNIRGLLTYAYRAIPDRFDNWNGDFLDCATDNAVTNQLSAKLNQVQTIDGYWTKRENPFNNWSANYDNIRQINDFLSKGLAEDVIYIKSDLDKNERYRTRLKGEAYFLRAWNEFDLLRRFGGVDVNGELMGIPVLHELMDPNNVEMLPRETYAATVDSILSDIDMALTTNIPVKYEGGDDVLGVPNLGRPNQVALKALRARVLLYAASPAFNLTNETAQWETAAQAAWEAIDMVGTTLPDVYHPASISADFYNDDQCEEVIMRKVAGRKVGDNGMEKRHFPPAVGLIGGGRCNPTQNLVDAFPMANGYPIDHAMSGYDAEAMYANRDPRFQMTVLFNGASLKDVEVQTYEGGSSMLGATGVTEENSTRTGYFLRKWLSDKVNLIAGNVMNDYHYYAVFRRVELFLNLAEAANEAWGPDDARLGLSARDAIREVRRRAGIAAGGDDAYLNSLSTKDAMRELIRNERRIELCFENQRFFDLRRWKAEMNAPVVGVRLTKNTDESVSIVSNTLFIPSYKDYMIYCPLPFKEVLKDEELTQNQGW